MRLDSRELTVVKLSDQQEIFCTFVASGESYSQAAVMAGFNQQYGRELAHAPGIADRIEELSGTPDKVRLTARYWRAALRVETAMETFEQGTEDWRANMTLYLNALDRLAKLQGFIVNKVDKRSVTLKAGMQVSKADVTAMLEQQLAALAPGKQLELKRIAAGEDDGD